MSDQGVVVPVAKVMGASLETLLLPKKD